MNYKDLTVKASKILPEVKIFTPSVNKDDRGTIFTTYSKEI
jgi:dTDP-4-dehydrorhamnose 3,5-epimerase-like enzyme